MTLVQMWEGLVHAGVRFIVIGGVAGVARGSARRTKDLDVCYDPSPDNIERLAELLRSWNAHLRIRDGSGSTLPFVIDAKTFRGSPNLTLETSLGWLDLLGDVTGLGDYSAALAKSEPIDVGPVTLQVLTLDALIESKRATGRKQDQEQLIELEAIRALKQLQATAPPKPPRRRRSR